MSVGDSVERSARARRVDAHDDVEAPHAPSAAPLHAIDAHLAQWLGPVSTVVRAAACDCVPLDVLVIEATTERPFHVLATRGVSTRPMAVPGGFDDERRAELLIALPPDWPLAQGAREGERHGWPLRWLERVARVAHGHDTCIGWGHMVPNGEPPEPIADTPFAGVMLMPPYRLPAALFRLDTDADETIAFYQLVPLHAGEIAFARREGAAALEALFQQRDVDLVVDPRRPDLTRSARRSWWPFKRS